MKGNIIVGQSGGPTAAINSSLAGVTAPLSTAEQKKYTACVTAFRVS